MRTSVLLLLSLVFLPLALPAQTSRDVAVLLSATVAKQPSPRITVTWTHQANATQYQVSRKLRSDAEFVQVALLNGAAAAYTDTTVKTGRLYEYAVVSRLAIDTFFVNGFGYICTGIDVPPVHYRGNVLVLVDSVMAPALAPELARLHASLESEGWNVTRRSVERAENFSKGGVRRTKDIINAWYADNSNLPGTVLLIGRVPVPYSGQFNNGVLNSAPDGHDNHHGAWPADEFYAYYGNESLWTDTYNDTTAAREANRNRAGDGKFDNAGIPDYLTLRVGRVDFFDMPKFTPANQTTLEAETGMLRAYLNKDYAYRSAQMPVQMRGLVDDQFGYFGGEAFARSGWMSMAPIVGRDNVVASGWFSTLDTAAYAWAYACGGGTYTSASGVGTTDDFVSTPVNAIFTMMFGSYFGDWDSPDNFLRAGLASASPILTAVWSGRPYWYFHTMAMGETTGDCALLTQNNPSYAQAAFTFGAHVALMGDPTLRMRYLDIPAPTNVVIHQPATATDSVEIEWTPPPTPGVVGYYVYRQVEGAKPVLINSTPVNATRLADGALLGKSVTYSVRTTALVTSPSGTFYDLSNKASTTTTITLDVNLAASLAEAAVAECHPNPARESVSIDLALPARRQVDIAVYAMTGQQVRSIESRTLSGGTHRYVWNRLDADGVRVAAGVYYVRIVAGDESIVKKVVVLE